MNTELTNRAGGDLIGQGLNGATFESWIKYIDASEKTVKTYTRAIRQFWQWLIPENHITQPTRADIIAYKKHLIDKGLKPTTVTAYITAVRLFFQWTDVMGIYPDIAKHLKGAKIDRSHKRDYLNANQCREVLHEIDRTTEQGKRDFAIVALMMTCGLRTIEVSRANIEDLRTLGSDTVLYLQGKGRTERTEFVKVPAPTEKAIRSYLKARGQAPDDAPLFASLSNNSKGERMSTRSISGIAKRDMQAAGFDDSRHTAHSLRHTAVTLALISNGGNIQEAQQFARHADVSTTMCYAHNLERAQNTCSQRVADAIF